MWVMRGPDVVATVALGSVHVACVPHQRLMFHLLVRQQNAHVWMDPVMCECEKGIVGLGCQKGVWEFCVQCCCVSARLHK